MTCAIPENTRKCGKSHVLKTKHSGKLKGPSQVEPIDSLVSKNCAKVGTLPLHMWYINRTLQDIIFD